MNRVVVGEKLDEVCFKCGYKTVKFNIFEQLFEIKANYIVSVNTQLLRKESLSYF